MLLLYIALSIGYSCLESLQFSLLKMPSWEMGQSARYRQWGPLVRSSLCTRATLCNTPEFFYHRIKVLSHRSWLVDSNTVNPIWNSYFKLILQTFIAKQLANQLSYFLSLILLYPRNVYQRLNVRMNND